MTHDERDEAIEAHDEAVEETGRGDDDQQVDRSVDEPATAAATTDATDAPAADAPSGEDETTDVLRERLVEMRAEADRIAELGTGAEQVEAAERFAEDAGALDEQVGAAARDTDDD
ncbi:MAG: hypothetical protein KDC46_09180 [Thermoleophilia bacterium]|nr:hypothetical protein [Thermoleophilia bacterium]